MDGDTAHDAARRMAAGRGLARAALSVALVILGLAALGCGDVGRAAAASAALSVRAEAGFGRVVFTFDGRDTAPEQMMQFNNGVLVLRFAEPIQVAVDAVPTTLPTYVMVARRDADGSALRFAVQRQVRVNIQTAGARLYLDFLPPTWRGPPPPVPAEVLAELAERARVALAELRAAAPTGFGPEVTPRLSVQVARRPGLTRLAFGWNVPFGAELTRDGDRVRVGFDRAGRADLAGIVANLPPGLTAIDLETGDKGATVILSVAPEVQARGFRDDANFVVDLTLPGADRGAGRGDGAPPAGALATIDLAGATAQAVAPPPPLAQTAKVTETALPAEPVLKPVGAPGSDPTTRQTGAGDLPLDETEAPALMPLAIVSVPGTVWVQPEVAGHSLTIPFDRPVAAAVFQRQESVFLVFDSAEPLHIDGVADALGGAVRRVETAPLGEGQVLRLDLARPLLATVAVDGNDWRIGLGDTSVGARQVLTARRARRGLEGTWLAVDLPRAGRVYRVPDPAVGDEIVAVTADGPARGVAKLYRFTGGALLPTAHGVAVLVDADDLAVSVGLDGVEVTRPGGLALSAPPMVKSAGLDVPGQAVRPRLAAVDGTAFTPGGSNGPMADERALRAEIVDLKPADRAEARLQLARLFLGQRLAPEALGTLRLASDESPARARDPAFVILYAAAQVLMGRAGSAREALSRGDIVDNADAAFWRTIAAVANGRFEEARTAARRAETAAERYPPDLAGLFRLAAAEAEIELGDASKAQTHLAHVEPASVSADLRGQLAVLAGRVLDASGRSEEAQARYDEATASGDRRAEAEAEYRRVTQRVRDGKMPVDEAIKRLQSLAFIWRGDQTELRTLRALANLQAQSGHWRDAFTSMRSADLVGPNSDETRLLQVDMAREFAGLYLDGKADGIDPIEALALYYDFRQLTPPGRLGDEIVRRLADRLVGVDLLDQAADLLTYQVDNRLRGAARAQIAADLAAVQLMNRKPAEALKVLNRTDQSGLSAGVERQRRLVRARALADTGAVGQALALIAAVDGDDAARLAGDILWRAKRWGEAGLAFEVAASGRVTAGAALDDGGERDVMRAAVAFALAGDELGLQRLASAYGAAMARGGSANAFAVVTRPSRSASEVARIAGDVAAAGNLRGFLDEYRKRYMAPAKPPGAAQSAPPAGAKPA